MMWNVIKDNKILKSYPTAEQCLTWCYLKGYVTYSRGKNMLATCISITEEEPENENK